jgi:TPP-dependent indolepyruvate ferredoxin oxidoreductase alpha subunit
MTSKIALDKPRSFVLLNGDEAVARGAIEAGIKLAAAYPGTPSTEILEAIAAVAKSFGIYAEWSTNEIVATEVVEWLLLSATTLPCTVARMNRTRVFFQFTPICL